MANDTFSPSAWGDALVDALNLNGIFDYSILGNTVMDYLVALLVFIVTISVLRFFKHRIVKVLERLAGRTRTDLDDFAVRVINAIGWPLYILVSLYVAITPLLLPELAVMGVYYAMILAAAYYIIKSVQSGMDYVSQKAISRRKQEGEADTGTIDLLKKIVTAILWLAAFLFIISSLGYDISGAVVGLGVSGIVIGFALQNVLSDLFASFSLYFDKPFQKGDFIVIGDDFGVVEKVGIQNTRIKHLKGHELIVSNKELTQIRINNYKKMEKRRVVFSFGVEYQTPSKKVRKIPEMVRKIIDGQELAETDRVHFREFGDSALMFEVVYYVGTKDYNKYMDIQQDINVKLMERFEKEGIEFAYPTQTIFLKK